MKKSIRFFLCLLILLLWSSWLQGDGNVVLKLRLYRGVRDSGMQDQDRMDNYVLRKIADAHILSDQEAGKEKNSIIKIYNLKYAHNLYKLGMVMRPGTRVETKAGLDLGSRKMRIRVDYMSAKPDQFKVGILPLEESKEPLLISEIIIPSGKTAVLGFEDSKANVFFLAIKRISNQAASEKEPVKAVEYPKLISRSAPPFPPEALAKNISGVVILECHTDLEGKVTTIHMKKGPKALAEAAKTDILKWKYSPWKINGKAEPVRMHLMIFYTIVEGSKKSIDTSEKAISKTLEKYKPLMRKWQTTYPVSAENMAILEIIIAEGKK